MRYTFIKSFFDRYYSVLILFYVCITFLIGCSGAVRQSSDIHIRSEFRLMAHRGGVVDGGRNPENSIAALDEAIKRGYSGVEIDIRQSKDGKLFLYHNRSFESDYDSKGSGEEMTWEEIQSLRPLKATSVPPVTLEEYCKHAQGKLQELMIDIKVREPSLDFYKEVERILEETGFLKSSYFIGHGKYFLGKGCKITMLMRERDDFFEKYGDKTKDYYFLFAGVDEINGKIIRWCKDNEIKIIAHINLPFQKDFNLKQNISDAGKNVKWLIDCGVVDYQIDSDYDIFFREE